MPRGSPAEARRAKAGVPFAILMAVNNEVLALILGGGQGTRLFPLTQHR